MSNKESGEICCVSLYVFLLTVLCYAYAYNQLIKAQNLTNYDKHDTLAYGCLKQFNRFWAKYLAINFSLEG